MVLAWGLSCGSIRMVAGAMVTQKFEAGRLAPRWLIRTANKAVLPIGSRPQFFPHGPPHRAA